MNDLTILDIDIILESFHYGKERIANSEDSSYEVKQNKLNQIDEVAGKLRVIKASIISNA